MASSFDDSSIATEVSFVEFDRAFSLSSADPALFKSHADPVVASDIVLPRPPSRLASLLALQTALGLPVAAVAAADVVSLLPPPAASPPAPPLAPPLPHSTSWPELLPSFIPGAEDEAAVVGVVGDELAPFVVVKGEEGKGAEPTKETTTTTTSTEDGDTFLRLASISSGCRDDNDVSRCVVGGDGGGDKAAAAPSRARASSKRSAPAATAAAAPERSSQRKRQRKPTRPTTTTTPLSSSATPSSLLLGLRSPSPVCSKQRKQQRQRPSPMPSGLQTPARPTQRQQLLLPAPPRTREDALALYRHKRARRLADAEAHAAAHRPKKILYVRRKANADSRPRIGGRFVSAEVAARLRAEAAAAGERGTVAA